MSAQFLSRKDRKKSLSGQKKKKNRTKKNILSLPEKLDVKNRELSTKNASTLTSILENLLPQAKLFANSGKRNGENTSGEGPEETALSERKLKRNQLLLGINVVSKGVQNNTAACVIIADDISPKLMTTHLKLLCASRKVPLVPLPGLRALTERVLGFPCIALGIKKNSVDFLPVTELISSAMKDENYFAANTSDDSVMEIQIIKGNDDVGKDETGNNEEEPFAYLYRDVQNGKRAFVPELQGEGAKIKSKNDDFIALGVDSEKSDNARVVKIEGADENIPCEGNPDNRKRKRKGKRDSSPGNGTDSLVEYSMAKVVKLDPNPDRESEKHKKLKEQ